MVARGMGRELGLVAIVKLVPCTSSLWGKNAMPTGCNSSPHFGNKPLESSWTAFPEVSRLGFTLRGSSKKNKWPEGRMLSYVGGKH